MKLATAADVLARMNLTNTVSSSNTTTVDSALEAATSIIESMLRTPLKQSTRTDYFSYSLGAYESFRQFDLWLTQRFVSGPVSVYVSADGNPITSLDSATLLDSSYYLVDPTKGRVTIIKPINVGTWAIAVRYSAGFTEGSGDIPDWLKEAAISSAVMSVHVQSVSHGKKDQKDMSRQMSQTIYLALNEYILTTYSGLHPDYSQVM